MPIALAAHCCGPLEGSPGAAHPNCLNGGSPACLRWIFVFITRTLSLSMRTPTILNQTAELVTVDKGDTSASARWGTSTCSARSFWATGGCGLEL
ncbi:hypothetical protein A1F99_109940 [Pyrenophora tritici-repentis]|nr:hypothetical protein A1F99_109940 [Pyrenophora tritici-repentis]